MKIQEVADSWIGTPFKQGMGIKGRGTDCYHLISGIIQETLNLPLRTDLPVVYHGQEHLDPVKECNKYYNLIPMKVPTLGSVLFFNRTKLWFMGLYLGPSLITVNAHIGVCYYQYEEYKKILNSIQMPEILINRI